MILPMQREKNKGADNAQVWQKECICTCREAGKSMVPRVRLFLFSLSAVQKVESLFLIYEWDNSTNSIYWCRQRAYSQQWLI